MKLICPVCSASYDIKPEALGPKGRKVRCANCKHQWFQEPAAPAALPEEEDVDLAFEPVEEVVEPGAEDTRIRPGSVAKPKSSAVDVASMVSWFFLLVVVLAIAVTLVARNELVARFPALTSVYEGLGLPVMRDLGLALEASEPQWQREGNTTLLLVEGTIRNTSSERKDVPSLKLTLLDEQGEEMGEQLLPAPADAFLGAGETMPFSARIPDPPHGATSFRLTFDVPS
ncbi:MAG: DUF3426 domain-containing protein [Geminicoccaceae bacterium]